MSGCFSAALQKVLMRRFYCISIVFHDSGYFEMISRKGKGRKKKQIKTGHVLPGQEMRQPVHNIQGGKSCHHDGGLYLDGFAVMNFRDSKDRRTRTCL